MDDQIEGDPLCVRLNTKSSDQGISRGMMANSVERWVYDPSIFPPLPNRKSFTSRSGRILAVIIAPMARVLVEIILLYFIVTEKWRERGGSCRKTAVLDE